MSPRRRALPRLVTFSLLCLVASSPRAGSRLGDAARAADLVAEATVAGPADEFGLTPMTLGRAARRPEALPATLLVRLPAPAREGSAWLAFLVRDEMASSLGAWVPVDPLAGLVPLDGRAGTPADLLAMADLAVAPPADASALGERLVALVGRGEAATTFGLEELLQRPEILEVHSARLAPALRSMLLARRVSPPTAALAVQALGELRERGDDVRLIDLVASEAPDVIVEAVVLALPRLATPATPEHLEHALGASPSAALPGLLRLVGALRARALAPRLCAEITSSRQPVRLAALASLAELRDGSCAPALHELQGHPDALTARAAAIALAGSAEPGR